MSPSADLIDLTTWADPAEGFRHAQHEHRDLVLSTSGTVHHPRRILRSTQSWQDSFDHVSALTGTTAGSRVWIPGSLTATMNLFAHVHARHTGAAITDVPEEATHAHLTPLALRRALNDDLLSAGTTVIVAGDALPYLLRDRAVASGLVVHHYYGASELSFVAWDSGDGLQAFPGVEIRVIGNDIWVRSPYVCRGYDDPSAGGPLRHDSDGFATVGDRGRMIGDVLTVLGRGDDAVTTAGVTVVVPDLEAELRRVAQGEVRVVGLPDDRLGSVVVAVVTDPTDVERLRAAARDALSPAQRPARWYVIASVPTTAAGKVDRQALVEVLRSADPVRVAR